MFQLWVVYAYTSAYTVTMASAPKCRSCGKVEWNHLCGGSRREVLERVAARPVSTDVLPRVEPAASKPEVGKRGPRSKAKAITIPSAAEVPVGTALEIDGPAIVMETPPSVMVVDRTRKPPIVREVTDEEVAAIKDAVSGGKTDRKEYLKLKARERRAAEKLGLTLEEYRKLPKEES